MDQRIETFYETFDEIMKENETQCSHTDDSHIFWSKRWKNIEFKGEKLIVLLSSVIDEQRDYVILTIDSDGCYMPPVVIIKVTPNKSQDNIMIFNRNLIYLS